MAKQPATEKIRALNDAFRTTLIGGRVVITSGVNALDGTKKVRVIEMVKSFTAFSADNDPHNEHDFGVFEETGDKFFWKIDYYDQSMEFGASDPADPNTTTRVITIMLAEEY